MKLLHISDLHLGLRPFEYSLAEDQKYILDSLADLAASLRPDAVIIAGDIYDKPVPPVEAVQLFDSFLTALTGSVPAVFVIAGNHDSAPRLSFASSLLSRSSVYVSPVYDGRVRPVILHDEFGDCAVWSLPYLRPAEVRAVWPEQACASFDDAVRCAVTQLPLDRSVRNVAIAHQFVTGAVRRDSEEITVGDTDNISASIFDPFDYTALGHLHTAQDIAGGAGRIRFCGSPLKYSFSEQNDIKSATLVTLGKKGEVETEEMPLRPLRELRSVSGKYSELVERRTYEGTATGDYLSVTLTDEYEVPDAIIRLRAIYPNIMKLSYSALSAREDKASDAVYDGPAEDASPLEIMENLYQLQNGCNMDDEQRKTVEDLLNEAEGEEL